MKSAFDSPPTFTTPGEPKEPPHRPVDKDEAAQREAEHKAASLHNLGWEAGAGATIWARSIQDELARHEAARELHAANTADREAWERLHGSALLLVVCIDQVLAFERRVRC